jgi:hypothetical protein
MAQLRTRFETSTVAPSQSRDPIPPGKYVVQIVASEWKATKAGTGQYLSMEIDILEGEHAGRKLWDLLNLENPNPKAVEIAEETLRDICHAQGKLGCDDSEDLHFIPMAATIKIKPGDANYGPKNEIGGYKALEGAVAPARHAPAAAPRPAAVAAPAARPAAANAPAAAPWRRAAG